MSRDEIEKGRKIWPPDIEKILSHYYKAEALDPKDFMTYKDRARLFHVLRQHEKSKEEYQKWFNLGTQWENEVTKEMELRKIEVEEKNRFKNITPWEYLERYFAGDAEADPTTRGIKKKNIKKKLDRDELKPLGFTGTNNDARWKKLLERRKLEEKSRKAWMDIKVENKENSNKVVSNKNKNKYRKVKSQIIEKPKKIFKTKTDENEKMREELIEKFIDDKYFKEIFPKLEINLKKISNKKILELIDKL